MLSFKQYLAKYPNGHKPKTPPLAVQKILKKRLSEVAQPTEESGMTMSKWELIRFISEVPAETVLVDLAKDRVIFQFVEVEIDGKDSF